MHRVITIVPVTTIVLVALDAQNKIGYENLVSGTFVQTNQATQYGAINITQNCTIIEDICRVTIMVNTVYTSRLNTSEIHNLCVNHVPQYTVVQKTQENPILVCVIIRVKDQPRLTWICNCGLLVLAGRPMRLHLAECKINKHYINNEEFDVDTSNGTSTKMNAIKLSTYKNLCVVPEFGKIIPGSTLGESTLRYHHEYIFGCASCGLRHRGLHGYELLLTHQKVNRCKIEGVTIVKPHSWNNFQKKNE